MANMGYCRFENTLGDLEDCYDHIGDSERSESEDKARTNLIKLCVEIALDYGDEVGCEVETAQLPASSARERKGKR